MPDSRRSGLVARADFPMLDREIEGRRIVYLDSAATALKPKAVVDAVVRFYEHSCANIHRGNHALSQEVSEQYEFARTRLAQFINAAAREVAFTANTTESLNLVAAGLDLKAGDNVVASLADHHSNIMPWMHRAELRMLPLTSDGRVDYGPLESLIDARTRLVALSHVSNVTGARNPIEQAIEAAHRKGVPVVIDAAQSAPHLAIDVVKLKCDFLAFSSHKMLGPSGVGVLFISEAMWDRMGTLKVGGGTPDHVRKDGFDLKRIPYRFEAGTPNIEGALGFAAAIEYLEGLTMAAVEAHDASLTRLMHERFLRLPGLRVLGPEDPKDKISVVSLAPTTRKIDVEMLAMILSDSHKIMARSGTHCAHPFFEAQNVPGALRLSAYVYTSDEDIQYAAGALEELIARQL